MKPTVNFGFLLFALAVLSFIALHVALAVHLLREQPPSRALVSVGLGARSGCVVVIGKNPRACPGVGARAVYPPPHVV